MKRSNVLVPGGAAIEQPGTGEDEGAIRDAAERDAATPLASQPLRECGQGCRINLVSRHHEDDVRVWGSGVGATRGQSEAVAVVHAVTVFAKQVPVVQGTPGEAVGMAQHLDRRREAEEREGRGEAEGDLAGHGGRVAHNGPVDCSAKGCPNMTDIDQIMVVVLALRGNTARVPQRPWIVCHWLMR